MPQYEDICYGFEDSVLYTSFPESGGAEIQNVMLCSSSVDAINPTSVYLGTPRTADGLLGLWNELDTLNLLIAECEDASRYATLEGKNVNLVVTDAPLVDLHNTITSNISDCNDWYERLSDVSVRDGSIGTLLATAVSIFDKQISLYLLSPTFHLVDYRNVAISPDSMLLDIRGDAPLTEHQRDFIIESAQEDKSTNYYTEPILDNGDLKGYLLIIHNEDVFVPRAFINLVTEFILVHAYRSSSSFTAQTRKLTNLLTDILLFDPKDVDPLYNRLADLPFPLDPCIRMLVISNDSSHHVTMGLIDSLTMIFPGCNIAPYDQYIIVLLSGDNFLFRPSFDEDAFEKFLDKNNLYAIFTSSVRFIRGLRIFFRQAKSMLHLLQNTDISEGRRFAFLDDYFEYTRVHTCIASLKATKDRGKLVYLFHPFIVELMRYDDLNNTDYVSFAFAFAKNDGNISQTANKANYHRNTVYNKITRIREIFGVDLNDSRILRELIFADHVIQIANAEGYEDSNFIVYNESRFPDKR